MPAVSPMSSTPTYDTEKRPNKNRGILILHYAFQTSGILSLQVVLRAMQMAYNCICRVTVQHPSIQLIQLLCMLWLRLNPGSHLRYKRKQ